MKDHVRSPIGGRKTVTDWMSDALPAWLTETVRPKEVPTPWGAMLLAAIAIWVPLAVGVATGNLLLGVVPALGAIMSVLVDQGGPYATRFRRVAIAGVFGGALGIVIGTAIHGRGWVSLAVLVAVAGVSAILARLGSVGSVTGLMLLVYCTVCTGPFGEVRPWWHTVLEFIAGVALMLLLFVPRWLLAPRSLERRLVATVYHDLAARLRAIGTDEAVAARHTFTTSLNAAYDALLTARSGDSGRMRQGTHLVAILNASHPMAEAATALRAAGEQPPSQVTDTIDRLANMIAECHETGDLPVLPPQWSVTPGARALRESMVGLSRVICGNWTPAVPVGTGTGSGSAGAADRAARLPGRRPRQWASDTADQLTGGWITWTFTIRLMSCMAVADALSEVLPLQRSYWVPLTVAVVLKPDYGSVFARALQRAGGTVLGAVLGTAILAVVPLGPWLLLPFGILAALLPYGKVKNYGLSATFFTPFVVLLIDLLDRTGWQLAADRAIDTVLGALVVLLVGYAPWPVSWHAHLPGKLAATLRVVCDYMDESLVTAWAARQPEQGRQPKAGQLPRRSRLRRDSYRALSDLRADYQRTMSEPSSVSRRASVLWPAAVALEDLIDAVTATVVAISRGAPAPLPEAVHQLTGELRAIAEAMNAGLVLPPTTRPLPADACLEPVTTAVRSILGVLTPAKRQPPELARESS
ncbi:MAG: hypothetical protein JWM19_2032 [Actinomycetia bacterium]|nr:hypothetical protein [Actinomycetes bacterium]